MNDQLIILFIFIPLAASFFTLIDKINHSRNTVMAKTAAVLSFAACFLLLLFFTKGIFSGKLYTNVIGNWSILAGISQKLDSLAWIGLLLMNTVSFLSLLYTFSENKYDSDFYFFFLLLHAGMAGMLLADDFFNLFVCLEITGISAYVMIAYTKKEKAIFASFKYLMLSSLGISLFLIGVFIVYRETGSLFFDDARNLFSSGKSHTIQTAFAVSAMIAGIGVRTAFIPYTWLPDAHAFAPHPVSAVLSGVLIKISFFAVWKLIALLDIFEARLFLLWMGAAIALIGVLRALSQSDFKVLLAWHSVSQMGFIFAGFGAGTALSVTGSMYHAISHGLFKSLLFLSVSLVIIKTGERSLDKISGMGGKMPFAASLFVIGALSIAGIPPFTGYVSKNLILSGSKDYPAVYWMLIAASVGTVASFTKLSLIFRGKPSDAAAGTFVTAADFAAQTAAQAADPESAASRRFTAGYTGMIILALLCLLTGIYGKNIAAALNFLVHGISDKGAPSFWKISEYIKTAIILISGILCYCFVISRPGKYLQKAVKKFELSFDSQLVLLLSGFIALFGFIYFH
ncbi:MAG: proton-conducting transporter membrane subunit [Spirochaetia bacterium]|jgi:multicomponent Na+:H+ antiporter subunit D|nr:proton-conducting transporter membrane subunit [Spirochaetia bacterium]